MRSGSFTSKTDGLKNGPSWRVRLLAAPRSVGPRFPKLTAKPPCTMVPPGVCGNGRSSQCGTHKCTQKHASWPDSRSQSQSFAMHSILAAANQHLRLHGYAGVSVKADAKQLPYEQHRAPKPVAQEHEKESKLWHMPLQQHDQTPRNP